jgi:hypothetical protein
MAYRVSRLLSDEIIAGLQEEQEFRRAYEIGDELLKLFLSPES